MFSNERKNGKVDSLQKNSAIYNVFLTLNQQIYYFKEFLAFFLFFRWKGWRKSPVKRKK